MELHKLLDRQIKKYISKDIAEYPELNDFLRAVNNSYVAFEREKQITEHAFEVSENEYQKVLENLKKENELKKESIDRIKEAIKTWGEKTHIKIADSEDFSEVIGFLEDQIVLKKELETTLIDAKENAEKAAKAKSDFLSIMSHEIRTPLNAIIGNIHILKDEEHLPSQEDFIKALHTSALNLLTLINDILDFSKIEDGKVNFSEKPIKIKELVSAIRQTNKFKAQERENVIKVMIDADVPDVVLGDEVRLSQILNNLISNALKFTSKGLVTIEVFPEEISNEEIFLTFSVTDTGTGIENNMLEKIFERFTQANTDITRQYGGSGLGLTIIRKLLHLQNSEILVRSEVGKGSTFTFTLKFKRKLETVDEKAKTSESIQTLDGVRVLLVEDVKFNVMVAKKMMERWKMLIDVAENGKIAVDKVKAQEYDVVLMDLQMPIMDGFTATKQIRKEGFTQLPIIALTASVSSETNVLVFESGMNDYLTKPFNPNDLFNAISRVVN